MSANGCAKYAEKGEQPVRFGVVADIQYAEKPAAEGRFYAASAGALQACAADFTAKRPDFVIQLGDLIDGGPEAERDLKHIRDIFNALPMPRYHILGNHDFVGLDRQTVLRTLGGMEAGYYRFDVQNWRFVVLDTQDLAGPGGLGRKQPALAGIGGTIGRSAAGGRSQRHGLERRDRP